MNSDIILLVRPRCKLLGPGLEGQGQDKDIDGTHWLAWWNAGVVYCTVV
jgi:hypothetical protein